MFPSRLLPDVESTPSTTGCTLLTAPTMVLPLVHGTPLTRTTCTHASRSNLPHHPQCPRNVAGMWFLRTSFFQVNGQGRGVCGVISLRSLSCYTISFPPIDTHFLQSKRQTDTGNIFHYNSRDFLRYDKASLKSLR